MSIAFKGRGMYADVADDFDIYATFPAIQVQGKIMIGNLFLDNCIVTTTPTEDQSFVWSNFSSCSEEAAVKYLFEQTGTTDDD